MKQTMVPAQIKTVKRYIRIFILKTLIYLRLYPHIFFTFNPFKIYEFRELLKGVNFSREDLILDLGCGSALQTLLLGKRCKKIIGIDISEKSVAFAKRLSQYVDGEINSQFRCVRIENAKFENGYFDKIFSICVIEHIPNYHEVLKESYRILKRDGQMIFSVDSLETIEDSQLMAKHQKDHFVEKYFTLDEIKVTLEEIGFNRIEVYPIFKSEYARRLFIKSIRNKSTYGYLGWILPYILLRYKEKHPTEEGKGIFLIVKCKK